MELFIGAALLIAAGVVFGLYSRIDKLEREVKAQRDISSRALQLISEIHDRPEPECEMAREARKRRRENAALGIYPET